MKSGSHSTNPGFSSTEGIQIYTGKFSQVSYDAASRTAVIGSDLIWDTVYEQLQAYNVTFNQIRASVANFSVYSQDPKAVTLPCTSAIKGVKLSPRFSSTMTRLHYLVSLISSQTFRLFRAI